MKRVLNKFWKYIYYGWKAIKVSSKKGVDKNFVSIFKDMVLCSRLYYVSFPLYFDNKLYCLPEDEKQTICNSIKQKSTQVWQEAYDDNWIFLNKYSGLKWETSNKKRIERANAYIKHYGLGNRCWVQYGVMFICEHNHVGSLIVGEHVLFARECDIDFTGDLTIGNEVRIMEGVKILTHSHDLYHLKKDEELIPSSNRAYTTPLEIGDNVRIGARALIMPGVKNIGAGSFIESGSVVTKSVPERVIVAGNPAQIVARIPQKIKIGLY